MHNRLHDFLVLCTGKIHEANSEDKSLAELSSLWQELDCHQSVYNHALRMELPFSKGWRL